MKRGTFVRMTAACKARMAGTCTHGPGLEWCPKFCSTDHVLEFGDCEGIVEGVRDYNNVAPGHPNYDPDKIGPELEVRWLPSNLRYGYGPDDLEVVG